MTYSLIALPRYLMLSRALSSTSLVRVSALLCATVATGSTASAHPNHSVDLVPADSAWHVIVEPSHAVVWGAVACGLWMLIQFRSRVLNRRLLRQRAS